MDNIDVTFNEEKIDVTFNEEKIDVTFEKILQTVITERKILPCIAGETLTSHKVLSLKNDGKVYLASNIEDFPIVGISMTSANVDETVNVLLEGDMTLSMWGLVTSDRYFLTTSGGISNILPTAGNLLEVGVALSLDKLLFSPKILLKLV